MQAQYPKRRYINMALSHGKEACQSSYVTINIFLGWRGGEFIQVLKQKKGPHGEETASLYTHALL